MYRLKHKEQQVYYTNDCQRICDLMYSHYGVKITLRQAEVIWEDYSEGYAAGWLILPSSDEKIIQILNSYVEYIEE